ncbi:FecR family protein [Runella aurantiaca]|uniref:FecR family protein n=1 Tax=Runella aurantiaca TaxID=2282308 RepID=A0A369I2B1_9BACT|nr:FecR family protein [Runella aurantiaca]RDB03879.1 FecR family protein [Runella aurantiaca]
MKDYTNYTTSDFILDDSFRRWVLKNTPTDHDFWVEWIKQNPGQAENVTIAQQFIHSMHQAHELVTEDEIKIELNRLSEARSPKEITFIPLLNRITYWKQAVAAVIVIGLVGFLYTVLKTNLTSPAAYELRKSEWGEQLVEIDNKGTAQKIITLPDGSLVTLYPKSRLSYPKTFVTSQRTVNLSGAAFFNVTKNPKRPFLVYANELVTKVLGTSFTVRAFDKDAKVEVIVKTGKVSVFSAKDANAETNTPALTGLILTPNQQVVFDRKALNMTKTLVGLPAPVIAPEEQKSTFTFINTPVNEAFEKLSNAYGVTIVHDPAVLKGCEISAEFTDESFYEQLDLICKAIDARYEVANAQIVIYSKGCSNN